MRIGICGCIHGALRYANEVLLTMGFASRHEDAGKDACVSHTLALVAPGGRCYYNAGDVGPRPEVLIHQVRHPLANIGSLRDYPRGNYMFLKKHGRFAWLREGDDPLHLAMKYWFWWTVRCAVASSWSYRVESLREVKGRRRWGENTGLRYGIIHSVPTNIGRGRKKEPLTWPDLYDRDHELTQRILELAEVLGYEEH